MVMREYATELKATLRSIENELELAEKRLNYTTNELLIDSIIFEMESLYKRHSYYYGLLRELHGAVGDGFAV
jgi:hypothetical protein